MEKVAQAGPDMSVSNMVPREDRPSACCPRPPGHTDDTRALASDSDVVAVSLFAAVMAVLFALTRR
jgi:hypothetical protein